MRSYSIVPEYNNNYFTFSGSETVTTGDFKPNLNVYEQKNKLGNDNVSYEAVGEKIHFKLKPDDFTPI